MNREEHLQIRVSPDERDMIITLADELDMSLSDFVVGVVSKYALEVLGLEKRAKAEGKTVVELLREPII